MSSKRRRGAPPQEISAGGVVVRGSGPLDDAQIVVIVPDAPRARRLARAGAAQGAHRPRRDRAGGGRTRGARGDRRRGEPVRELGEARYWYRRDGRTISKSVSFYLFSYVEGDTEDHDDEVEEARWIGLKEAQTELTHAGEREMVARALACLEEGGPKDR